jgi:hypothetical protein
MIKTLILTATAAGFALCTATYTRSIAASENARAAAPLAAPWLLCATATLTAAACAGAAAADAANRKASR